MRISNSIIFIFIFAGIACITILIAAAYFSAASDTPVSSGEIYISHESEIPLAPGIVNKVQVPEPDSIAPYLEPAVHTDGVYTIDATAAENGTVAISTTAGTLSDTVIIITDAQERDHVHYPGAIINAQTIILPITGDGGMYRIVIYTQEEENMPYKPVTAAGFYIGNINAMASYLSPSSYVPYDGKSKAAQLAAGMMIDSGYSTKEFVRMVGEYISSTIGYNSHKADTVERTNSRHLQAADETLKRGTGVCSDITALMVAMLRSQGVPARVAEGYYSDVNFTYRRHAWVEWYDIKDGWIMCDPTNFGQEAESAVYTPELYR